MRKKLVGLALIVGLLFTGVGPAQAHSSYCGHGSYPISGSDTALYITYDNVGGYHFHTYKHQRWRLWGFYTLHWYTRAC